MKTVKIVPGTDMQARIKQYEEGNAEAVSAIAEEATELLKASGYSGEIAVVIDTNVPDKVPSRIA